MNKIIAASLMAFCFLAVSTQEASAWVNSKFGIGFSWDVQSGGNSLLWGLWRDGQPPGPEAFGFAPRGPMYGPPPGGFGGGAAPYYGGGFPPGGVIPGGFAPPYQTGPPPMFNSGPPGGGAFTPPYIDPSIANVQQGNPFQFSNYSRPVQYQYYPNQWYGNR